jgi:hypothetical protein
MSVVIFKDVTQEDILVELEANGKKYEGLYVDMKNKDERKYVKDQASTIKDMLKKLDRARIDKSKDYKVKVEAEAKSIRERLEEANKPFTLLIDEYNEERAKILAAEKAEKKAKEDALQLLADHELAILMNEKFDLEFEQREAEKARLEQARLDEIERQKQEAAEQARREEIARQEAEKKREEEAKAKREANIAHISGVRTLAKEALIELGITEEQAKIIVIAIHNRTIPNVTINY